MAGDRDEVVVRPCSSVRTLLLTKERIAAFTVDQRTGTHHALEPTESAVWALLDRPMTTSGLVADLSDAIEVDHETARGLVESALAKLHRLELLGDESAASTASSYSGSGAEPVQRLPRGPDP